MKSHGRVLTAMLSGFLLASGCKVENVPSRAEQKLERQQKKPNTSVDTTREAPASNVDDVQLVLATCGRPESDRTLAIYSKLDHGPVRELRYKGLKPVLLEFVPNHANVRGVPGQTMRAELPAGDVWTFDDAYMEQEEMMTTGRLRVYLPCAAKALARED